VEKLKFWFILNKPLPTKAPYTANACAIISNAVDSTGMGLSCSELAYSTAKIRLHAGNFWKMSFFGNDDPFRHKTQQMCCTWSVRVCVQNVTIVRHGIPEDIGARENEQILRYLVDKRGIEIVLGQLQFTIKKMV